MFPLGTVLFPHALLPLHVFEPRYRLMIERVLRGEREFGVVLIERGSEVGGGDVRFAVGAVARVVRAQQLPDGGYALATVGMRRVRIERWLPDDPYPQAEVVDLSDSPPTVPDPTSLRVRARALNALGDVCGLYRLAAVPVPELPVIADEAEQASYEMAALAPIGPLDAQRVLEAPLAVDRLALLAELLEEHAQVLRAGDTLE